MVRNLNQSDLVSRIFHVYRLGLSSILLGGYLLVGSDIIGKVYAPNILFVTAFSWFISATITSFSSVLSKDIAWLSCANFVIDMIALTILGWATGGLNGGLFFLMLPSAAMAGLILSPRYSLLVAATASIATLFAQTLLILDLQLSATAYFSSGVLGIILFLCTTSFSLLSQRLSKTEALSLRNKQLAQVYQQLNENIIEHMETGVLAINDQNDILMSNRAAEVLLSRVTDNNNQTTRLDQHKELFDQFNLWKKDNKTEPQPITLGESGITIKPSFESMKNDQTAYSIAWLEDMRTIQMRVQHFKYQSLSKLSSGLAHEIRNPLSAIQQANELLIDSENITDLDRELTDIIKRHCKRMNDIIEVIQQLSRNVEANRMTMNLSEWLTGFIFEFKETQTIYEEPQIEMQVDDSLELNFDPRHLKQILTNLLENGLRHGGDNISQTIKAKPDSNHRLVFIDLYDSGLGIARKKSAHIFDPFFTTSEKGSGLGLYLARELCEANYASINYLYMDEEDSSGYFRITSNINATKN